MGVACTEERPVMHWQQSARYLGASHVHDRNISPSTGNLTLLNPLNSSQCYQPSPLTTPNNDSLLHRPSCLTCPTIGDHCDHSTSALQPHHPHNFHPFHHTNPNMPPHQLHGSGPATQLANKNLMVAQHAIFNESCHNFEHDSIRRSSSRNDSLEENSNNFPDYYTECKKEASTPPSNHLRTNNNNNNINNNHDNNNQNLQLHLKTEPICNPDSPESSSIDVPPATGMDDCAGCGRLIQDRFYLSAVEKKWHAGCLQCCICSNALEGQASCFARDGRIYCKNDYFRIYGARRCSKCLAAISSSELVMRARHLVYHIRCFSCAICNQVLNKGDQFGIRSSAVYCRLHYEVPIDSGSSTPFPCQYTPSNPYCDSPNAPSSPSELGSLDGPGSFYGGQHLSASGPNSGVQLTGLPQQPRQKGRPRKRKPKDIEAMTSSLDLNADYLDLGFSRGSLGGGSSRTKRMRTSFKHHQLRTMKSYFAINHNPDAKDLKQLSQKTGLPKRVLQVWFQNARAKWRRMMMKQEGKSMDEIDKGEGSIDLDTYNPHSPSYMLGPASPTSME